MANITLDANNWKQIATQLVDADPTVVYKRLKHLYPNEVPLYTNGYERNGASKMTMKNLIIRKAEASGNPVNYLKNVL